MYSLNLGQHGIRSYDLPLGNRQVVLVDTPGLNDSQISSTELFCQLTEWLRNSYNTAQRVCGVLYLHRILDNRMTGSALSNLHLLQMICGEKCYEKIYIGTTFWDAAGPDLGQRNENILCRNPKYWAELIAKGAKVERIGTSEESQQLLLRMITTGNVILQLQEEMKANRVLPQQTTAGALVFKDWNQLQAENDLMLVKIRQASDAAIKEQNDAFTCQTKESQEKHLEAKAHIRSEHDRLKEELRQKVHDKKQAAKALAAQGKVDAKTIMSETKKVSKEAKAIERQTSREGAARRTRDLAFRKARDEQLTEIYERGFKLWQEAIERGTMKIQTVAKQNGAYTRWCNSCCKLIGLQKFYRKTPLLIS